MTSEEARTLLGEALDQYARVVNEGDPGVRVGFLVVCGYVDFDEEVDEDTGTRPEVTRTFVAVDAHQNSYTTLGMLKMLELRVVEDYE